MDPRGPDGVGEVENVARVDQQEAQVPRQDVHGANVESRPQREEQDTRAQHNAHHQRRHAEVVRHQER